MPNDEVTPAVLKELLQKSNKASNAIATALESLPEMLATALAKAPQPDQKPVSVGRELHDR